MPAGRLITLEGGEGAGKSTQANRLAALLRAEGIDVLLTREPGGAPGAERLRTLLLDTAAVPWPPMAEALLHYAARVDHLDNQMRPALARGTWVISDRFTDSTMAYQGYGQRLGRRFVRRLHALVAADAVPDLTLILDLPPELGLRRAAARRHANGRPDEDRYEGRDLAFHRRVRRGFIDIARRESDRCAVIDATADVEAIAERIAAVVRERLDGWPRPRP